jgi:hypothetical protein
MLPPVYTWLTGSSPVETIVGTRVYRHQSAPQDTTRPYVTWGLLTGAPENELSDLPVIDRCSIEVDCWHQTDEGVEDLATAVRNAIEPYGHMLAVTVDLREPETKLYRMSMQFDIWLSRLLQSSSV